MAGTIDYDFSPNDPVWVITDCGVKSGVIVRFRAEVSLSATAFVYDVRLDGVGGSSTFESTVIFSNLDDALIAYKDILDQ